MFRTKIAAAFMLTSFIAMADPVIAQLKSNDRIVFLGDSITQAGDQPGGYVTIFRDSVKNQLPDMGIEVLGAGISGNKVPDLQKRLQQDVLDKKPSIVVIYIGINDVWHSQNGNGTPVTAFESGLVDIIDRIKKSGARVVLCTPSVIGEKHDGTNDLDAMLDKFSGVSRRVAEQTGSSLLDLRQAFLDYLRKNNLTNQVKNILTTDGVHLNAAGNRFVAAQMLQGLGVVKEQPGQVLRHVVLFKFKEDLAAGKVDEIVDAFGQLPQKIDAIIEFENGINISTENLAKGFTHCFMVTFADVAGRDAYLVHPAHQQFVELIDGRIADVVVADFWSNGKGIANPSAVGTPE